MSEMGDTIEAKIQTPAQMIQRHIDNVALLDSSDLTAACNALGVYNNEQNVYYCEDNIVETTKDLIRYLRKDSENHEVRRFFGQSNIVGKNLLPLLRLYWQQTDLFDILLRLLGNLTSPVLLLFEEEIPKDRFQRHVFLEILEHLQIHKQFFLDTKVWACLTTRLQQLLNIPRQERGTENELIIERILILVRNVLSVPADLSDEKRADNDVSAQDRLLWILEECGFMAVLHYMVSSEQEEAYYMYLLEILSHMLKDHRAQDLALMSDVITEKERCADEKEFEEIRNRELTKRKERMKNYTSARHSRFGGTYLFQNMKSVHDSQELIYHKKLNTAETLDFDINKSTSKVAVNRRPVKEVNWKRRSPFATRLHLKTFCIEFLNSGYNRLMHDVRGKLVRGKTMDNDESYYLWALTFFMEFNRHYKFDVKLVSETIGREIFHYVQQRMEHNFEMIISDKKKWYLWSKRLHLGISAYKEMLYNVNAMDKSQDETIRENAKILKSNIFYVVEYREFILTLLAVYDEKKMSDAYLLELIETQHIFLKMFEVYCGKNSVVVQQIKKVRRKKKPQTESTPTVSFEEALELKWDEVASQLSTVLEGGENIPTIAPFDAASDVPIDEQRKDAMVKIQDFLRDGEVENAIGMLRSARDVWPDNDAFGSSSMTPEEEFLAIREIFFAKLRDKEEMPAQDPPLEEEDEEEEEDDDARAVAVEKEVDIQFIDFVKRFAQPKIIHACGLALRQFDTNSAQMNHHILKLLHRIAYDCKMSAMLFQASIFRTFQRIFREAKRPQFKELVKFATYIIREFVRVAEKNKKIFMELLFWKNSKEAYDAEEGYGSYETSTKAMKKAWTEEQENELRVLVMEYKERGIEEDMVDWILNNMIDNTKSHIQIKRKLKDLSLVTDDEFKKNKNKSSRAPQEWSEAEISQLEQLYNQFHDAIDPLMRVTERLDVKRPKARVKQKIIELGLADNNALRKKRSTKARDQQEQEENFPSRSFIEDEDTSSSDEENEDRSNVSTRPSARKEKRPLTKKTVRSETMELPALKKLILAIIDKGMSESLKWISECLLETAEDQEQEINLDDNEGIPLVAITENDAHSIQTTIFEKFLRGIGIQKPCSEQEKFWRIPGTMPASNLKNLANFIDQIVEKGAQAFPEHSEAPADKPAEESSDDDDVFDRIRNFMHKPSTEVQNTNQNENNEKSSRIITMNDSDDSEQNENDFQQNNDQFVEFDLQNGMLSNGSNKVIMDDSEGSNSATTQNENKLAPKKKTLTILDSDESENESNDVETRSKRSRSSDSDSSNQKVKRKKVLLMDSDED